MYCPRCRFETEDNFCEICGGSTVDKKEGAAISTKDEKIPYPIKEEIKKGNEKIDIESPKVSFKKTISSICLIVFIIAALIGYNVLKSQYTPIKTVQKYYKYLANEDYENAYKMLTNTDNKFLGEDIYISSMKQQDFKQYTIENYDPNDFKQAYGISNSQSSNINTSGNMFSVQANERLYPISVVDNGKKLLFFKDYKINADSFTTNWKFTAPEGTKISILGKEPVKSNEPNVNSSFMLNDLYNPSSESYEIEYIFNGTYNLIATMEGAKDAEYSQVVAGNKINIEFEPTGDLISQLQEKAKSFLDLYYANSPEDKYVGLLATNSKALSGIKLFGSFSSDKVVNKLKDIKVTKQSLDDINHATISVKCSIDYEDSTWISWGGEKQTGNKDMTTDFYFVKENDKWLIVDTGYIN